MINAEKKFSHIYQTIKKLSTTIKEIEDICMCSDCFLERARDYKTTEEIVEFLEKYVKNFKENERSEADWYKWRTYKGLLEWIKNEV